MVFEGVKLMALGMGVVGVFLSVMVIMMSVTSCLLKGVTRRDVQALRAQPDKKKGAGLREAASAPRAKGAAAGEQQRLAAVIGAALAAHRERRQ